MMSSPFYREPDNELAPYVEAYQRTNDLGQLMDDLKAAARRIPAGRLKILVQPFKDMPEVVIPLFEQIVATSPDDAQAMVVLANAYWLAGRGPDAVNRLASQAKAIDPNNRGAWHRWALAESNVRQRVDRWVEVTRKFPEDQLARAALADNAVSLATDEDDPVALKLAISTYEGLLAESKHVAQRLALEETLKKLRSSLT
jgi:tetratricopeptide (TPR) repeat protein